MISTANPSFIGNNKPTSKLSTLSKAATAGAFLLTGLTNTNQLVNSNTTLGVLTVSNTLGIHESKKRQDLKYKIVTVPYIHHEGLWPVRYVQAKIVSVEKARPQSPIEIEKWS